MTLLLILLVIILLIFIIQIELKAKLSYNIKSNTGTLVIKLFKYKIINYYFTFKKGYIEIITHKKQKFIPFELNAESIKEVSKLDDFIFSKIYFKRIDIFLNVGIKDNAYYTALLNGVLNVVLSNTLIALKNAKNEVVESIKIYSDFNKTILNGTIKCKISISIIDLIWCVVENIAFKQIYKNTIKNNE